MSERIYSSIFSENLRELGYFADEALGAKTCHDFFYHIAKYIAPLLRKSKALESFYFQQTKDRLSYDKKYRQCEASVVQEIESSFQELHSVFEETELCDNEVIKKRFNHIKYILDTKARSCIPMYYELAYSEIQELLYELIDNPGGIDLIRPYTIIDTYNVCKEVNGKKSVTKKLYIEKFLFAPSRLDLKALREVVYGDKVEHIWVAYNFLEFVEWCWNTPFSFFEQYAKDDSNAKDPNSGMLMIKEWWVYMNQLREKRIDEIPVPFLQRDRYVSYLKLVLNSIVYKQALHDKSLSKKEEEQGEYLIPYSIERRFVGNEFGESYLLLDVRWDIAGSLETYKIHTCYGGSDSDTYTFCKDIFGRESGDKFEVDEKYKYVSRCLSDIKVSNILGEVLFLEKIEKNRKNKTVIVEVMPKNVIVSQALSQKDQVKLAKIVKKLDRFSPPVGF